MRLVLFDIDGTLLLTGRLGQSSAEISLERIFGTSGRLDNFYPTGRTIEAIFKETLGDIGIGEELYQARREALYSDFFGEFKRRLDRGDHHIHPLPGALDLLEYLRRFENVITGLVTGNHQYTAQLKLRYAGFDPGMFQVGAYGDESVHRPDLVRIAQSRAAELTGVSLGNRRTVMIGDTARDVASAKEHGAVSVAVASGNETSRNLAAASPDHLLPDLTDLEQLMEIIQRPYLSD